MQGLRCLDTASIYNASQVWWKKLQLPSPAHRCNGLRKQLQTFAGRHRSVVLAKAQPFRRHELRHSLHVNVALLANIQGAQIEAERFRQTQQTLRGRLFAI